MSDIGTVGKYTLRRILGKGAMGVVYEAFDPMIERTVALKTIRKDLWEAEDGAELRERFLREARAAGRLLHPGIVTVYEFGEDDGGAFIVMEHVCGRTLKEMIDDGKRFAVDEVVTLMVPVLAALGYSHRAGVIHRDIKPANLMVTDDGQVKILDFGVARLASASITQIGTILGTPAYMAPEQLMGQTVDSRADLYSAGVILRELLCGQKTFSGDYGQVLHQVLYGEPPPPSTLTPSVPRAFDAIVARAMAKLPDQRFASAEEFIEALRHPTAVRPLVTSRPAGSGRSSAVPVAIGLVLLLAAGAGGAYRFGLFGEPAPVPAAVVSQADPKPDSKPPVTPEPARIEPPKTDVAVTKPEPVPDPAKPVVVEPARPVIVEPARPVVVEPAKPVVVEALKAAEVEPAKPLVDDAPKPNPVANPAPTPPAATPPPVEQQPRPVTPEPAAPVAAVALPAAKPDPALTQADVVAMLSKPVAEPPPPPRPKAPALNVVTDRGAAPRYKVGEAMQVMVSIERQAEVFCFYQSAAGEIVRVFPTRFAPDATLKARQLLKLPGAQPFSFQFDRKNAREEVRCLGLDTTVAGKLPKLLGGAGFEPLPVASMNALVDTIRRTAGEEIAVGGVVVTVE